MTSGVQLANRAWAVPSAAQTVAAIAGLATLVDALADANLGPRWPLSVTAAVLGLGLAAGPVGSHWLDGAARRRLQTVATVLALLVLILFLPADPYETRWPEAITSGILALGLGAGPVLEQARTGALAAPAARLLTLAGLLALINALADANVGPRWQLTVAAVLLVLALFVVPFCAGLPRAALGTAVQTALTAAVVALLIIFLPGNPYGPRWPEVVTAGLLGAALLIAGPLAALGGSVREGRLSARVDELSRTRRGALDIQASELRRIERDLHDGAQARLVALSIKLGAAEERYRGDAETAALLGELREDATAAIRELRDLARGIAPPVLTDRGLEAAVRSLAQRSETRATVNATLRERPLPVVENAAYFVIAEALTNAAKHARGAAVEVHLDERNERLVVGITDFGPGGADPNGDGLVGLRQRVEALDGTLVVTSPAGVGTQIEAVIPCGR